MEISHEQYIAAFNKLPPPVRSYLIDDELTSVMQKIGTQYGLHVDAIGALGKSASYMLMGLQSPAETVGQLVLAGVDGSTAQKILSDLNTLVFVPVHDRVKNYKEEGEEPAVTSEVERAEALTKTTTPATTQTPSAPEAPQAESRPVAIPVPVVPQVPPPPAPAPIPAPAPQPVVPVSPPPAPVPPPAPMPAYTPPVPQEGPSVRTMATDMQAVREHRTADPIPYTPASFQPPAPPPAPPTPPTPAPRPIPAPPPNLPGTGPVVREYGVDPYREPVE